jgi:hypothetical protein
MFGCTKEEVTGGWRKLYNEELHNVHSSPNVIRVIKSRRIGWWSMQHAWGDEKCTQNLLENLKGGDHL